MKVPVSILAMFGLAACSPAAFAQTNPPAAEVEALGPALAATNGPALAVTNGPALAATNGPALAATNGPALAATNDLAQRATLIPLIIMDEVPLTDAIENLARQASLNYLMDPKLAFGQPGADGRPVPQPSVTIRLENISAEQALYALLANHNLQLVGDPKSRIARVTVKDPAALPPLTTRVVQLRYASPTNILLNVRAALTDKRGVVLPDVRTSQLVVIATDADMENVDHLVERLDSPTKQVLIEARLMETSMNPTTSKGVDWTGTLQGQNIYFGNGTMSGSSTLTSPGSSSSTTLPGGRVLSGGGGSSASTVLSSVLGTGGMGWNTAGGFTPATGFLNADGVHAVLSFLNTYTETKLLDCPRTVTLDNETAIIEVGTMFPIVNTTAGTVNVSGGSQISYSNLTVRLEVTPRISADHFVQLKVRPQILRLGDSVKTTVGDAVNIVYEFNTRDIRTSVMIPSGNTLVMGGLVEDDIQKSNTKVPILGDIPGLGLLFRNDTKNRTKSNLIMFLTPTIIEEKDFQPTKSNYLKTPVPTKDTIEGDWSAWDSGAPKRWTKPKPDPATSESDDNAEPKHVTKPKTESTKTQFDENVVPPPSPKASGALN
jgi:type II secretory pathway component GspD/PulD (secretin)